MNVSVNVKTNSLFMLIVALLLAFCALMLGADQHKKKTAAPQPAKPNPFATTGKTTINIEAKKNSNRPPFKSKRDYDGEVVDLLQKRGYTPKNGVSHD